MAKHVLIRLLQTHPRPNICIFDFNVSLLSDYIPLALCLHPLSLPLWFSLSLMMGVFLFCGGCELSDFVSVSVIPSLRVPAYKRGRGPGALSHRPPVPAPCLLLFTHSLPQVRQWTNISDREKREYMASEENLTWQYQMLLAEGFHLWAVKVVHVHAEHCCLFLKLHLCVV